MKQEKNYSHFEKNIIEGCGCIDLLLAKLRYKTALKKISCEGENNRILDIGCGAYPLFLSYVNFVEKYGLDSKIDSIEIEKARNNGIILINHKLDSNSGKFPFESNYFDAITMLAVFEHIEPVMLINIHKDIYRILKPDGLFVLTTPAFWTEGLLKFLAQLHVISDAPIKEHKGSYDFAAVSSVLCNAGFSEKKLHYGYFELFMNMWVTARK